MILKTAPQLIYKNKIASNHTGIYKKLTIRDNHIDSVVCEILSYRQKSLLLYIIGYKIISRILMGLICQHEITAVPFFSSKKSNAVFMKVNHV